MRWKRLESRVVYRGPTITVREDKCELSDGNLLDCYVVTERKDIVTVCAITDADQVVLVEQYRYPLDQAVLEVPGGNLDGGEEPLQAARRELVEETGFDSEEIRQAAAMFLDPSNTAAVLYAFVATGARPITAQERPVGDEMQEVRIRLVPRREVVPMIQRGEIRALDSITTLLLGLAHPQGVMGS